MSDHTGQLPSIEAAELWRAVLAEYPTGVALVSAVLPDGEPTGLIVGSFVAISQDPPLIGYFGDDSSQTFRPFVDADRFAVSIFSDRHDGLLRSFIRKDEGRFDQPGLTSTPGGLIRLDDPVAWFEARRESVQRFGDHRLVVGSVEAFGVGSTDAGSPLLYRRGGFGAFAIPSDSVDARLVQERLAGAQAAAELLAPVAERIGRDIAVTTLIGESVVIIGVVPPVSTAADGQTGRLAEPRRLRSIGTWFPFAAPAEPLFAAWASDRTRSFWIERARHLVGSVDRRGVESQLAAIRERGYSVSVDEELTSRFFGMIADPTSQRESYAQVWSEYAAHTIESVTSKMPLDDIAAIQVPVFDGNENVVFVLTIAGIGPFVDADALDRLAATIVDAAHEVSELIARTARGRN